MAKNIFKFLSLLLAAIIVSGCMEVIQVIKIKRDGSGTLTTDMLINQAMYESMRAIQQSTSGMFGDEPAGSEEEQKSGLMDIKKLKTKAEEYGEGVAFVSAKELKTKFGTGYQVVYAFEDISKVKLNQNPGQHIPPVPGKPIPEHAKEHVQFGFEKGKVSTFTIKYPEKPCPEMAETGNKEEADNQEDSARVVQAMEFMKKMFAGMRVAMLVEVKGKVVKTNAEYVKKNRITLMDMDFEKIMAQPDALWQFSRANPKTVEETKELVKDVPGIKVDQNKEIVIKFK